MMSFHWSLVTCMDFNACAVCAWVACVCLSVCVFSCVFFVLSVCLCVCSVVYICIVCGCGSVACMCI